MISRRPNTDEPSTAEPGGASGAAIPQDMQAPAAQLLEVNQIDLRLEEWRLTNPPDFEQLQDLICSEGRIRDPLLVSTAVVPGGWVLVDGFKRLRVARQMRMTHVWVHTSQLDEAHAKAMMLQCNQPRTGMNSLEEARIVYSLCLDHSMMQRDVAELLKRSKSWVCRQLQLARDLDGSVQEDVMRGTLSATIARKLSQLPRDNQKPVAQAVIGHELSTRECTQLVQKLQDSHDEQAAREVLDDPRRYIDPGGSVTERTWGSDPRLSKDGNRLRSALLSWPRLCSRLTDELRRAPAADAAILAPLIQDALTAGTRVVRQLEATHGSHGMHLPAAQAGADHVSPAS